MATERYTHKGTLPGAMVEELCRQMGLPNDAGTISLHPEVANLSFIEMARHLGRSRGVKDVSAPDFLNRMLTTSDLPKILADAVNKVLQSSYRIAPGTFAGWTARNFTLNFHPVSLARVSPPAELQEVGEDDEYQTLDIVDGEETARVRTFGGILPISRQALTNDDTKALADIGKMLGITAKLTQNRRVYSVLLSNPVLSDGVTLFHADRGNLMTGGASALSRDSLATALKTMRSFTDDAGNPLSVEPKFLLVPPSLEITAHELCFSDSIPGQTNAAVPNLFKKLGLQPIVEPLLEAPSLTGNSSTGWYLLPDPNLWPVVTTLTLSYPDNLEPYVEEKALWKQDGVAYKSRIDFEACAVGHYAIKSAGA